MLVQHSWTFTNLNLFSSQLCSIREYKTLVGSLFFPPMEESENKEQGACQSGTKHKLLRQDSKCTHLP